MNKYFLFKKKNYIKTIILCEALYLWGHSLD